MRLAYNSQGQGGILVPPYARVSVALYLPRCQDGMELDGKGSKIRLHDVASNVFQAPPPVRHARLPHDM